MRTIISTIYCLLSGFVTTYLFLDINYVGAATCLIIFILRLILQYLDWKHFDDILKGKIDNLISKQLKKDPLLQNKDN